MKNLLFLSITGITIVAVTATTLYAQTVAGSSIVDKMKAAARNSFALSADLNPGQTGFDSAPVSGKKTGNMLTAAEWNRMLEIVSQGRTGGAVGEFGWENVPLTDTNSFNQQCMYRVVMQGQTYYLETIHENRAYWNPSMYFDKANKSVLVGGIAPVNTATKMEKLCGGASSGTTSTLSNLVYINPDNTDFAPLQCTPGVNYMINPIGFSAASATAYTTEKVAVLGTGSWQLKGTGFFTNRNRDSSRNQVLRISFVLNGTTTHIYTNSQDQGLYGSRFDVPVSVPTGKTADILVGVQNLSLYGGNIVAWCTN